MTAQHADQLIDGYLARLRVAAADLPAGVRQELIEDVRTHIAEARSRESDETDASVLNILDRLGEPAVVVADTRERLGLRTSTPYRPGLLEVAAVILVPFFWPIGVILLWMSPAWHWRGVIFATAQSGGSCVTVIEGTGQAIQNGCPAPAGPSVLATALSIVAAILIYTLPLITAGYLALRLRWGRRTQLALG
ncbi:MAG: hypothetical protein E6I60_12955 [Chloroflexi bacterium]|nr:MAG: hypothetical protein E6I60_12955 [Chloroflexota bacterium]